MTPFIDDEAEGSASFVFCLRHQKPPLHDIGATSTAEDGDHFDHTGMMAGGDCRRDDPVAGMTALGLLATLLLRDRSGIPLGPDHETEQAKSPIYGVTQA